MCNGAHTGRVFAHFGYLSTHLTPFDKLSTLGSYGMQMCRRFQAVYRLIIALCDTIVVKLFFSKHTCVLCVAMAVNIYFSLQVSNVRLSHCWCLVYSSSHRWYLSLGGTVCGWIKIYLTTFVSSNEHWKGQINGSLEDGLEKELGWRRLFSNRFAVAYVSS